jgi:hypothetical protein
MVSLGIIKSTLFPRINIRLLLFVLGVLLPIENSLSVSRMLAQLFNALSYAFHDIKHIVQPYLDDLPAHSMRRVDHPTHLRAIFIHCRFYSIRLNPHKCVFCVESGRLLGFIVSRQGIRVDPLKVEAIPNLPPPSTLRQLQSLQGVSVRSHSWIACRSRAQRPSVLCHDLFMKGDQMEITALGGITLTQGLSLVHKDRGGLES